MTEMKSKALPKALVDDEDGGVANAAAGKDEQPKPRNYKWLAVFFMSVALVSIAIVTKSVGAYTQKHVYAVSLTSRLDGEPLQRKVSFAGRHLQAADHYDGDEEDYFDYYLDDLSPLLLPFPVTTRRPKQETVRSPRVASCRTVSPPCSACSSTMREWRKCGVPGNCVRTKNRVSAWRKQRSDICEHSLPLKRTRRGI